MLRGADPRQAGQPCTLPADRFSQRYRTLPIPRAWGMSERGACATKGVRIDRGIGAALRSVRDSREMEAALLPHVAILKDARLTVATVYKRSLRVWTPRELQ